MTRTEDGFVAAVGFVLGGFGLASAFLPWSPSVAIGPVESWPGLLGAVIALLGFATRRYGFAGRRGSVLAGVGSAWLAIAGAGVILWPETAGSLGPGGPVAFLVGVLAVGVAYADYRGQGRAALLGRAHAGTGALFVGLLGLLVGNVLALSSTLAFDLEGSIGASGLGAVAFSLGLALVAVGYALRTEEGLAFFDVAWPSRQGWVLVVGGTVGMFLILGASGALAELLGVQSVEHGMIEQARAAPAVLLLFVPLSWLAIGPGEELLSRNVVQKHLYGAYSRPAAVVVATGIFAAIHLPAYATGPPPAIFATLLRLFGVSLVLGAVYERTDNVVVPAIVHGTYNAVQFGLVYVAITTGAI